MPYDLCMHAYYYLLTSARKNSNIYLQLLNKISNIVNEIVKEKNYLAKWNFIIN